MGRGVPADGRPSGIPLARGPRASARGQATFACLNGRATHDLDNDLPTDSMLNITL
jgi:hypothetical protein